MTQLSRNVNPKESITMKKTLIVLGLACALVFAFAASAMARPSGNLYIEWDAGTAGGDVTAGPHKDYQTGTEKCAVCHSVHYAATAGAVWADSTNAGANAWTADAASSNTQMLLRSSVSNACNYCHITSSIGGVQLYGGNVANFATSNSFAHNTGCSGCHAVHGASTFAGGNNSKLLRVRADRPTQPDVLADGVGRNTAITALYADMPTAIADGAKYTQQVAFCTQCHHEYTSGSEHTITPTAGRATYYDGGAYTATPYKGHPVIAATADFAAAGDSITGPAAFVDANTCRQCHDAGNVDEAIGVTSNSFPHFTNGYYAFQTSGARAGVIDAADVARVEGSDGNCLKCHVNAAGTSGVGITY